MINKFYEDKDVLLALRGFLVSAVKGFTNLIRTGNNEKDMGKNYKKQYEEAQKKLDALEKALTKYSNKLRSEAGFEIIYGREQKAKTLEQTYVGINRILSEHYPAQKLCNGFMYSVSFQPSIMWDRNIF
jgi:hypothetical protein